MHTKSRQQILNILPVELQKILLNAKIDFNTLQEIRVRIGKPFLIQRNGIEQLFDHTITKKELQEILEYISKHSMYAYETEVRQGFLTIEGGHRVGIAGRVTIENREVKNYQYVTSLNIRICHEIRGCADEILPFIIHKDRVLHSLLLSAPGRGKTTILRDLVRQLSDGSSFLSGQSVCVVDERSEIGGAYQGIPQNDIGRRTDLLDNCPKAEGMLMMIRSMSPKILAVDEIGTKEDIFAISCAIRSGISVLATAHADSLAELIQKNGLKELYETKCFERYIFIGTDQKIGKMSQIYDQWGNVLCS